jgi:hypothetical protein
MVWLSCALHGRSDANDQPDPRNMAVALQIDVEESSR